MIASDLLERTRRHLYTESRDERNRLAAAAGTSATSLSFDFSLGGIAPGAVVAVGLEEMLVWEVSGATAIIERGIGGTPIQAHADGDLVWVNPKVSPFGILQAINEDLADLSSPDNGLYRVRTVQVTFDGNASTYDLAGVTDLIEVIDVTYDTDDGTDLWATIPRAEWRLKRGLPTSAFSSGLGFELKGYAQPGAPVNLTYKSGFTSLAALTDDVATTGLSPSMYDLPPLGAAIRLTAGSEVARNFLDQGETRRAGEVPAGARNAAPRGLMMLRNQRIAAEAARLYAQYPVVKS